MKVKEFIARLEALNPEAEVLAPPVSGIVFSSYPWEAPVVIDAYKSYVTNDRNFFAPADHDSRGIYIL